MNTKRSTSVKAKSGLLTLAALTALATVVPSGNARAFDGEGPYAADAYTIALYHLNEGSGTTACDVAPVGGANDMVYNSGSPTWLTGKFGGGIAEAANVRFFSNSIPTTTFSQLTLDCWIKPTPDMNTAVQQYLLCVRGADSAALRLDSSTNITMFFGNASGWYSLTTALTSNYLYDGNWHQVAGTFNGGVASVYVDNVCLANCVTVKKTLSSVDSVYLGCGPVWSPSGGYFEYTGAIDEARISNISRTDFRVPSGTRFVGSGQYEPDSHAILLYHLNEGSGAVAADAAPLQGANDASAIGGSPTWNTGTFGSGLSRPYGETNYFSAAFPTMVFSQLTLDLWIRPTLFDSGYHYVAGLTGTNMAFLRLSSSNSVVEFCITTPTWQGACAVLPAGYLNDGNWHQVAGTFNGGTFSVYVDNLLRTNYVAGTGMTCSFSGILFNAGAPWDPANQSGNPPLVGLLDEVRLSDTARTKFQLSAGTTIMIR